MVTKLIFLNYRSFCHLQTLYFCKFISYMVNALPYSVEIKEKMRFGVVLFGVCP